MDSDSAGELHDDALSAEIKLLGALMLAASSATGHLTLAEVDHVLEVETAPSSDAGPPPSPGPTRKSKPPRSA